MLQNRNLVLNKNISVTSMLQESRLYSGSDITVMQNKFMKKKDQIENLLNIVDKVKAYIKENKQTLLKNKGEDEKKIK